MKKLITTILFALFIIVAKSQVPQGLDYRIDYDQKIEDLRREDELDNEAYAARYNKIKAAYKNALEVNTYSAEPKASPTSGWCTVLMTDGNRQAANRSVFLENGVVTKYVNGKGEQVAPLQGGKVIDFKTVVLLPGNARVELYFNIRY